MAQMPPQAAPAGAPTSGPSAPAEPSAPSGAPSGGGASELVSSVYSGLAKLMQLVEKGAPEDAQALAQVMDGFKGWVEQMGASPSAAKSAPPGAPSAAPMETRGKPSPQAL